VSRQIFVNLPIADPTAATAAIIALSAGSREAVDEMVAKAVAAAAPPSASRRTTATCTATASRTRTVASGSSSSWNPARCRRAETALAPRSRR